MKLFITGGAGFIGSHFIRHTLQNYPDDSVVNVDALTYAGNLNNCADIAEQFGSRYEFVRADIADAPTMHDTIRETHPDAIINFAAESHVDRSIEDAAPFLRTNVTGVYTLLEQARLHGVARFVQISTDEVYGEINEGAFTEASPVLPRSPYAASKAAGDLLARAYWTTYGLPVIITRSANAYGSHQYPEKMIPLFVINCREGRKLPLYGDGLQRRHWTHVLDHCSGINVALRQGKAGEIYNLASDETREYTNLDIARMIAKHFGKGEECIALVKDRPGHDRRYRVNANALRALGWRSAYAFSDSLPDVIAWYEAHDAWWKPLVSEKVS